MHIIFRGFIHSLWERNNVHRCLISQTIWINTATPPDRIPCFLFGLYESFTLDLNFFFIFGVFLKTKPGIRGISLFMYKANVKVGPWILDDIELVGEVHWDTYQFFLPQYFMDTQVFYNVIASWVSKNLRLILRKTEEVSIFVSNYHFSLVGATMFDETSFNHIYLGWKYLVLLYIGWTETVTSGHP